MTIIHERDKIKLEARENNNRWKIRKGTLFGRVTKLLSTVKYTLVQEMEKGKVQI